jgi:hypothetical protein
LPPKAKEPIKTQSNGRRKDPEIVQNIKLTTAKRVEPELTIIALSPWITAFLALTFIMYLLSLFEGEPVIAQSEASSG